MSVAASAKRRLAPPAKAVAPRWFWRRKYRILARLGQADDEMRMVRSLCDPARVSVDIGADVTEMRVLADDPGRSTIATGNTLADDHATASIDGPLSEDWTSRGVYINNFVFPPN